MCRGNERSSERQRRTELRYVDHVRPINQLVDTLRCERGGDQSIPYVDPDCGGTRARVLLLLQDPGPKASATTGGSGFLSLDNDDDSAERVCMALGACNLSIGEFVYWNTVPWSSGLRAADMVAGKQVLASRFLPILPDLRAVVTMGSVAHNAWKSVGFDYSSLRHFRTFHPAGRGITNGGQQTAAAGTAHLRRTLCDVKAHLT